MLAVFMSFFMMVCQTNVIVFANEEDIEEMKTTIETEQVSIDENEQDFVLTEETLEDEQANAQDEAAEENTDSLANAESNNTIEQVLEKQVIDIELGDYTVYVGAGETVEYRFIPNESRTYYFYSHVEEDTYARLLDASYNELMHDDDSGEDNNFYLGFYLEAGETYYYEVKWYNEGQEGDILLSLTNVFNQFIRIEEGSYSNYVAVGKRVLYSFTPEEGGDYIFYSKNPGDYYACWYDSTHFMQKSDCVWGINFCITCPLEAGERYYFTTEWNDEEKEGEIPVVLKKIEHLYEGNIVSSVGEGETAEYKITPTESGFYYLYSLANNDTYATLYDMHYNEIAANDDGGCDNNFKLFEQLEEGNDYYLGVRWYDSGYADDMEVVMEKYIPFEIVDQLDDVYAQSGDEILLSIGLSEAADVTEFTYLWERSDDGESWSFESEAIELVLYAGDDINGDMFRVTVSDDTGRMLQSGPISVVIISISVD